MVDHKEKMLKELTNEWQFLTPIAKRLNIQYYQAKMVLQELIIEKKAESCRFGPRIKYKRTPQVLMSVVTN